MRDTAVDTVLTAPPPTFTEEEAAALSRELFGVDGEATPANSERDQTFLIDAARPAVLKISNAAEDPARLDMEALAAQRIVEVDNGLPVALPWQVPGSRDFKARITRGSDTHYARMYDRLPGRAGVEGASLSDAAVLDWGATVARVGRALRGFWSPAAGRVMLWDVQNALLLRPLLNSVADTGLRALVERSLERYEQQVTPLLPTLRHQVIHTDHCASNTLVDEDGFITGIIDFGDASWSALVVDLAAVLETVVDGREQDQDEFFRVARIALDGYERITPLETEERRIVGELLAARMCAGIVIPSSRARLYSSDDPALFPHLGAQAEKILRLFEGLGWDEVRRRLGGREPGSGWSVPDLVERRERVIGPAMTPPSYRDPIHLSRGSGVWLYGPGRRYLDAYNNVPVVGHEHPRVVEAIARQARRLNTNMRYLHETALEVAERLIASTGGALDTVMFVNSGSEANDIAWRIGRAATGGTGGIASDYAYHGITEAISALTPEDWIAGKEPAHVRTWRPSAAVEEFARAVTDLQAAGFPVAVAIMDGVLTSDGIIDLPRDVATELVRQTHEAGALWVADEVQSGHGRTGAAMWGYQRLGITPDIVTVGKPMGNGHPVAAVITRAELARAFAPQPEFFSTFGGNPVAMAAALAVLEVMDDERIIDNARTVGDHLGEHLRAIDSPQIKEVRQIGLAVGVEMEDAASAKEVVESMRQAGVLIGTTGRHGNVLKIRPPLVFSRRNADQLVATLTQILSA
ncbi:MAG TPA: aminotransferase class III-fold pyridoxal phosphate-dependent enzyme [Candidatus Limnocylindrales bacterium]